MNAIINVLKFLCSLLHETKQRDISAELEEEARQAVREYSAKMAVK